MDGASTTMLDGYRIKLPDEYYGKQLIYPDEDITNGLRFEGTSFVEPFVNVDPNELSAGVNPTLTEETYALSTLDEESHVNLSRMLSLAVVDYLKAMLSEQQGDLEVKEYYMKQFWKKVGDNESNKRKTSMSFPSSPYAVR
ncbi:MAG: hypothetical protein H8D23_23995 [Candidatus Brocadiales bacterium]|nr:hypothetical protein [Candidatus Brocadiales bacterium]